MKRRYLTRIAILTIFSASVPAQADETRLGATIGNIAITKHIPAANLGLQNKAAVKTVDKRDLRVTGNNPTFTVTGQIFCKGGAKLVEAQAFIGSIVLNNGLLIPFATLAKSAKLTSIAGRSDADVSLSVTLPVTRKAGDAAIDFSFNPARTFEHKLKTFTSKGGSAVTYLREAQAFDMPVQVSLAGWCKMPQNADSVLAGDTYAGYSARSVPVTILYKGDPKIVDGIGVRASAGTGDTIAQQPGAPADQRVKSPSPPRAEQPKTDPE